MPFYSYAEERFIYRTAVVVLGWSFMVFLVYKTAGAKIENKVYDPFEILGLSAVSIHIFSVV
jgi:translocation protein SEC63